MASPEFPGIVDNTVNRTAEAAGIVKEGLTPAFERGLDSACQLLMSVAASHKKLRRFMLPAIGRFYFRAIQRQEERFRRYPGGVLA